MTDHRTTITIQIAGEEYTIRSEASREHTLECARYVDRTIAEIMDRGTLVEAHKAAILAALALADQLFHARRDADLLRRGISEKSARLLSDIETTLSSDALASPE